MKDDNYKNVDLPQTQEVYVTEQDVRNLITTALANYSGIVRFTNLQTVLVTITDFSTAQHTHANAAGGGQITDTALSSVVTVPKGGSGVNTITGIIKGNGAGAFTAVTPLAGTKIYYVSDSSGGAVTRKLTFTDGILTAET